LCSGFLPLRQPVSPPGYATSSDRSSWAWTRVRSELARRLATDCVAGYLGVYSIDEEAHPWLDLDDARALLERGLRPTDVVIRNRPKTQRIARDVFGEGCWSGVSWWSMHRPQWTLLALWRHDSVVVEEVQPVRGHPALHDAGRLLARRIELDLE
jgi:hypothetical protein